MLYNKTLIASDSNTDTPMVVVDDNRFCVVQWENTDITSIVSQSGIIKSPQATHVNDVCFCRNGRTT
jgi:hypothetical protein